MTFVVLAPEHHLVEAITTDDRRSEVEAFVERVRGESDIERQSSDAPLDKRGVFTGAHAINPFTGSAVPVFLADYVLITYGTGAIMAVPGEDQRDWDFARAYELPIIRTVQPPEGWEGEAYTGDGACINSDWLSGTPTIAEAKTRAIEWLEQQAIGERKVNYRIRDWLLSRQRYWGCPIPVVHCPVHGIVKVPEEQLPVLLPDDVEFRPTGESPLRYHAGFLHTTCPICGGPAERETDTMDTFVDSSWYFERFCEPWSTAVAIDPEAVSRWMAVDQYIGGIEHAILHLLYARFYTRALADVGLAPAEVREPFARLFTQGMITMDHAKMSKSRGNVIPRNASSIRWGRTPCACSTCSSARRRTGSTGVADRSDDRRLPPVPRPAVAPRDRRRRAGHAGRSGRVLACRPGAGKGHPPADRQDHRRFRPVVLQHRGRRCHGIRQHRLPAHPVSGRGPPVDRRLRRRFTAPPAGPDDAPHHRGAVGAQAGAAAAPVHAQAWPVADPELVKVETVTMVVQVNGKVRDRIEVDASITEQDASAVALAVPRVVEALAGRQPNRVIVRPPRLVNVVV